MVWSVGFLPSNPKARVRFSTESRIFNLESGTGIVSFVCGGDQLILQPFRHFTYVTTHSPTLPSFYLRHSSFSNPSVTSTSQLILQIFRRFTYVTAHSLALPLLHLRHSSFSNPSFAFLTSHALHLRHLAAL